MCQTGPTSTAKRQDTEVTEDKILHSEKPKSEHFINILFKDRTSACGTIVSLHGLKKLSAEVSFDSRAGAQDANALSTL